jgi:hypothetical protein
MDDLFCQPPPSPKIKLGDITDGTANTYLLGEKNIDPDWYWNGEDPGDSRAALVGDCEDVSR